MGVNLPKVRSIYCPHWILIGPSNRLRIPGQGCEWGANIEKVLLYSYRSPNLLLSWGLAENNPKRKTKNAKRKTNLIDINFYWNLKLNSLTLKGVYGETPEEQNP